MFELLLFYLLSTLYRVKCWIERRISYCIDYVESVQQQHDDDDNDEPLENTMMMYTRVGTSLYEVSLVGYNEEGFVKPVDWTLKEPSGRIVTFNQNGSIMAIATKQPDVAMVRIGQQIDTDVFYKTPKPVGYRFLSIHYETAGEDPIEVFLDPMYYIEDNQILSDLFLQMYLQDNGYADSVYDHHYKLSIMDHNVNTIELVNGQWLTLGKDDYVVESNRPVLSPIRETDEEDFVTV
jgi:hypothetical protein